jgi:hypothetical protein
VQHLHGVAEQDLGMQIGRAVCGHEVMQVQRQRRVAQAIAP